MLKMKNGAVWVFTVVAVALLVSCAPPGRRAVVQGQRLLKQGKYEAAVNKLRLAISLLPTNAVAWNSLALAYHHSGNPTNAANAYRKALSLNPDLVEARYNLGCLLLEQNRLDGAKAEFTAYTMRRPKDVEGWLKLGSVQLRLREVSGAEKSFSDAWKMSSNNPAALNGLGLAQLQRNHPREAARAFGAALKAQPDYGPALLNLAIVWHVYLNNRQFALEKYREYASLKPRPADADAVLATVQQLEQDLAPPPRAPPGDVTAQAAAPASTAKPQTAMTGVVAVARTPKVERATDVAKPPVTTGVATTAMSGRKDVETVKLVEPPAVKVAQDAATVEPPRTTRPAASPDSVVAKAPVAAQPPAEKRGFFQRLNPLNWFRAGSQPRPTPLPSKTVAAPSAASATAPAPVETVGASPTTATAPSSAVQVSPAASQPPAPPSATQAPRIPRYVYRSPPKPSPGNRRQAELAFAQGLAAQRANRPLEAIQAYRQATQADPSYFEAFYNEGVAAHEAKVYQTALSAYENALAINPDSLSARYNFALVLRDSGYLLDAAAELGKVVLANPDEARAHLALGNLYALRLHQPARARQHYLRVLEIEPQHPQATVIRYWLAANPG